MKIPNFFSNKIGGYKIETKLKKPRNTQLKLTENTLIDIELGKINEISIHNEYDKEEIKDVLEKNNTVLIKGYFAGVGKTTASNLAGNKILYITPFNKQCQELRIKGFKAITIDKLFNLNFSGKEYNRKTYFDVIEYDCIIFDEVFMNDPNKLGMIWNFINRHTDKKIIATGDLDQLSPFGYEFNNIDNKKDYMNECINHLFPNQITLKEIKRLTNEEDKRIIADLKNDIFDTKQDVM